MKLVIKNIMSEAEFESGSEEELEPILAPTPPPTSDTFDIWRRDGRDLIFIKTKKGIYRIEVILEASRENYDQDGNVIDFPYALSSMTWEVYNVPGFPKMVSKTYDVQIDGNMLVGSGSGQDITFVDKEMEIIPKIKFLLDPLSFVEEKWGIRDVEASS